MPYIPHTPEDAAAMLAAVGVRHLDDLFADIPPAMRPKSFNLPSGLSEGETRRRLERMAAANATDLISFLGAGFYDHDIPAAVDALSSRGEFYTAYTPYQPEAAQGTLQAIFEYQTAVCRLLDMDAANASVYDGGSAVFEAAMMAVRATRRSRLVLDEAVNPLYRNMLATLTAHLGLSIEVIPRRGNAADIPALTAALAGTSAAGTSAAGPAAAVIVQNPGFLGAVSDFSPLCAAARAAGTRTVMLVNPLLQAVLKTPGEMGADVAVAEGQSLGLPLSFGGPYLGVMTCTKEMIRQMPGRIVGRTKDLDGKTGYVLTLQAREQHIRRAKATSNICSNQALCALRGLMHICLLGPEGLERAALLSMERAREAAAALTAIPGVRLLGDAPFAHEFAVELPLPASGVVRVLAEKKKILAGAPLGRWYAGLDKALLVACTEKTASEDVAALAEAVREAVGVAL